MPGLPQTSLDWKNFLKFESQIKSAVQKCYGAVDPRILFRQENCYQQSTKIRCPPLACW